MILIHFYFSIETASGEDASFTPKVRKEMLGGYHSHSTPQSTVPSPGAASINSIHEEYPDMSSPGWPRTPASPVCTFPVNQLKRLLSSLNFYIHVTLLYMS